MERRDLDVLLLSYYYYRSQTRAFSTSMHSVQSSCWIIGLNTSPNGSRERPPAELNKIVELLWFCECDVWSELTGIWRS